MLNLLAGIDAPAGGLHIIAAVAAHGTVVMNSFHMSAVFGRKAPATVTYSADLGWKGVDTVRYTVGDADRRTVSGTVTVTTLDAPPIAPTVTTAAPAAWTNPTATTIQLLSGASDPNGDVLTLITTNSVASAHGGTFSISGGSAIYTPAAAYGSTPGSPSTDSFTYTVTDGTLQTTGVVHVALGDLAAPEAHDDQVTLSSSSPVVISVLANDVDPSGAPPVVVAHGSHGLASVVGDTIQYAPSGTAQADSFTYSITDPKGQSSTATVHISVALPVAHPTLMTDTHDYGTYQHLRVMLHGLANGLASTVTITITGFDGWAGVYDESVCGPDAGAGPSTITLTCTYTSTGLGDQQLLHFDFIPNGSWSFAVTVAGTNYQGDASASGP